MTPVLASVVTLGLGGAGAAAAFTGGGGSAPAASRPASPVPAVTVTTASQVTSSSAPAPAAAHVSTTSHIGFALTVTGRVAWVELSVPGRPPLFEGLLRHGRTLRTAARPLHVVVGDAGAVRMVLHGYVHARLGRPGQVLVFTVVR